MLCGVFSCGLFSSIFVGMVPEASFKEDLGGEGRDKEVGFTSLEMRE